MFEFDNLKRSYIAAVQFGLTVNTGYQESKYGNEVLHEFCKQFVENGIYQKNEKIAMKQELEILKKSLEKEIETYYQRK